MMNKTITHNRQVSQDDDNLYTVLKYIENNLREDVVSVKKLDKLYGSKSNNNIVITIGSFGGLRRYVLKFSSLEDVESEISGTKFIKDYLPVPKTILFSLNGDKSWLLREYVPGVLMTDITNHFELSEKDGRLEKLETEKERLIIQGYEKNSANLSHKEYINLTANNLFHKRITSTRYDEYYLDKNMIPFLDKQISVNGRSGNITLGQMFENIRTKYTLENNKEIMVFPSHGDAHQGNILVSDKGKIHFFDSEYSGMLPAFMDLSKPYYNDLIGALFFYFHSQLLNYFEIKSFKNATKNLDIEIRLKNEFKTRMELAKIKLKERKKYLDPNNDFLTLNDYLFMCHTLTKNPNLYPEEVRILFFAFCFIIYDFDSLQPESLYGYFVK